MSNTKERILEAGKKAVEELIKVLEDTIIGNSDGGEITPEKMKIAASAKRVAFDDALYIHDKIESESKTDEDKPIVKEVPKSFAEQRAASSGKKQ